MSMSDRRSAALGCATLASGALLAACVLMLVWARSQARTPDMAVGMALNPLVMLAFLLRIPLAIATAVGAIAWLAVRYRSKRLKRASSR